ncbi:hypothetical protein mRhiFer1_009704 [Rhinolophus ferrumequinum]|uniref:Uncharacterized protein n=1 Tax=Rhinolophus ferrumequinum TaxID=59479 RepID=A0A7J7QZH9_RHIFE|nr:hypothetical protein mRhiFer1_009704 [Rhinolophus ferrumequinum]
MCGVGPLPQVVQTRPARLLQPPQLGALGRRMEKTTPVGPGLGRRSAALYILLQLCPHSSVPVSPRQTWAGLPPWAWAISGLFLSLKRRPYGLEGFLLGLRSVPSSAILQKRTLCCTAAGVCLFQAEGILFPFSFSLPYSGGSRLARRNFKDGKERAGKTVDQQTTVFQALGNFFQFSSEFPRALTHRGHGARVLATTSTDRWHSTSQPSTGSS